MSNGPLFDVVRCCRQFSIRPNVGDSMAVNTKHPLELELAKICETADIRVGFAGGLGGGYNHPTSDLDPPTSP